MISWTTRAEAGLCQTLMNPSKHWVGRSDTPLPSGIFVVFCKAKPCIMSILIHAKQACTKLLKNEYLVLACFLLHVRRPLNLTITVFISVVKVAWRQRRTTPTRDTRPTVTSPARRWWPTSTAPWNCPKTRRVGAQGDHHERLIPVDSRDNGAFILTAVFSVSF